MARILVVDDDEGVRLMLRVVMEKSGHEVVEAVNGHEAILAIRKQTPALVIMDIIMPEKEGLETILELRGSHPGLPVIAISGGGRIGSRSYLDDALKFGAAKVIPKPLDLDVLRQAVADLILAAG
jgi:DNA-binding NtrC family response regulator